MNPQTIPLQPLYSVASEYTVAHPLPVDTPFLGVNQVYHNQLFSQDPYVLEAPEPGLKSLIEPSAIDYNQYQYCNLDELFPSDIISNIPEWEWGATITALSPQQQIPYQPQLWIGQDIQSQLHAPLVPNLPSQELNLSKSLDPYAQFLSYLPSPIESPSFILSQSIHGTLESSLQGFDIAREIDAILKANYDPSFISDVPLLATPSISEEYETDHQSSDSQKSEIPVTKRKRKPRKNCGAETSRSIKLILRCPREGCKITCSSYPSLIRHLDSHKWRGRYQPLRCEACQNGLSNEYAVQRHILRSAESARCRDMSLYSFMKSKTEIETTVKFYPGRPHGKKTVVVDLEEMKSIYSSKLKKIK